LLRRRLAHLHPLHVPVAQDHPLRGHHRPRAGDDAGPLPLKRDRTRRTMIKPDRWIRDWGRSGGVTPFEEGQVNAASYDVRVSDHWICPTRDPEEFHAPHIKLFPG